MIRKRTKMTWPAVGVSSIRPNLLGWAAEWCMQNPAWKLTLQAHKVIGVR